MFANSYAGELSSGSPPMEGEWAKKWVAKILSRSGEPPRDWKRAIVAAWRADFKGWQGQVQKNGEKKPDGVWQIKQRLEELEGRRAKHANNPDGSGYVGDSFVTAAMRQEFREIETKISELRKQLSGDTK